MSEQENSRSYLMKQCDLNALVNKWRKTRETQIKQQHIIRRLKCSSKPAQLLIDPIKQGSAVRPSSIDMIPLLVSALNSHPPAANLEGGPQSSIG